MEAVIHRAAEAIGVLANDFITFAFSSDVRQAQISANLINHAPRGPSESAQKAQASGILYRERQKSQSAEKARQHSITFCNFHIKVCYV